MTELIYGIWEDVIYDYRTSQSDNKTYPNLVDLDQVVLNANIRAFVGDRGFLVFDKTLDLAEVFRFYLTRASQESCGKCTPCRVGTKEVAQMLQETNFDATRIESLKQLANHILMSSLCGLGKSCCRALIGALNHFPEEFGKVHRSDEMPIYFSTYVTAPCIEACPAHVDIPRYIDLVGDDRPLQSFTVLTEHYPEVASCGRVCVRYCESACRRGFVEGAVAIKALKRYVADTAEKNLDEAFTTDLVNQSNVSGRRVAIVGAGPAGVTCAFHLLRNGIKVDLYEAQNVTGGMLVAGIPTYRLPKDIVKHETQDIIESMGGQFYFNQRLGTEFTLKSLKQQGYDAIFVAIGAGQANLFGKNTQDIKKGLYTGIGYLWRTQNLLEEGKATDPHDSVVVIGGGNVAMDCVRTALRLGAKKVTLIYRRDEASMTADPEEIKASLTEGIDFLFMTNPIDVVHQDGEVVGLRVETLQSDPNNKRKLIAVANTQRIIPCSAVIGAIGQKVDRALLEKEGLQTDDWGCISVNDITLESSVSGVFAGGDCVLGPKTMIEAMAQGEKAAKSIREYLRKKPYKRPFAESMQRFIAKNHLTENEMVRRAAMPLQRTEVGEIDIEQRRSSFNEVELVMTKEEAFHEAKRCLRCYRMYSIVTDQPV